MLFKSLAELLEKVAQTNRRLEIIGLVADFLRTLDIEELEPAISMIVGRAFPRWSQKKLNVSWATLKEILNRIGGGDWSVFADAFNRTGDVGSATKAVFENIKFGKQVSLVQKELAISDVRRLLDVIAQFEGPGSREKKERSLMTLFSQVSPIEAKYLVKIILGEMRTGLHEGLMEQVVAKAFDAPLAAIQRASMLLGDIREVAALVGVEGKTGLFRVDFRVFRPVKLMLAKTAQGVSEALLQHGGKTAFEYKYDGARVQVHKQGSKVSIFSRRLLEVASLPEVVESIRANVKSGEVVLEGEVVAVDEAGYPLPFQHLMRRFRRVHGVQDISSRIPVRLYLFDILYLNGESLVSLPYSERRRILAEHVGEIPLTEQIVTQDHELAEDFLKKAIAEGHEGLMAKSLRSPYTPGIRGKHWLKIKPILSPLDLVITSAEYGYGRRRDWLSDYYLAARDPKTGEFLIVGKTFKGLTDTEMIEMTQRLKALAIREKENRVWVIPKMVVEVLYNEIQKSPKYRSEMSLRFARINRIRYDKNPEDADTINLVKEIYEKQFTKKGRYKAE